MGNMLFSQRVSDKVSGSTEHENEQYRIFPEHMYKGPKGLGDPYYRGLSKMENDPMITQRIRDTARTAICKEISDMFVACSNQAGLLVGQKCKTERDNMVHCIEEWLYKPEFRDAVAEEYLNERSHYRETGFQTKRYARGGKFIHRDVKKFGPALDAEGNYRPQKPTGWDESYPDGPPKWANFKYD